MKLFNKYILLLFFLISGRVVWGQQQPNYSQFSDLQMFYNPASVGVQENLTARFLGRWQWIGFEGNPVTYAMGLEYGIPSKNLGLGMSVVSDKTAQIKNNAIQLYAAYQMKMSKTSFLSMGLSGAINILSENLADAYVNDRESLFSSNYSQSNANFGLGFHYQARNWWAGVSMPFILNNAFEDYSVQFYEQSRHLYVTGGYDYVINEHFSVQPSVLLQMVSGNVPSWDANILGTYNDQFTAGIGMRSLRSLNFIAQSKVVEGMKIGYAYELTVDKDLNELANSSHEIVLTIRPTWFKSKDADGDGIIDKKDDCPQMPGPISNNGCPLPDSDGDGVLDINDQCPEVAGLTAMAGCPDSDHDEVADKDDQCPDLAGEKALNGCPDSDKDGIIDSQDECPEVAGLAELGGCPQPEPVEKVIELNSQEKADSLKNEAKAVLDEALTGVKFRSGKDVITEESFNVLDKLVAILQENQSFKLKIEGYTDSSGNDQANLQLSIKRANAVKQYLIDKGIDQERITANGYGEAKPIASNDTADGRAKNRRVEFEIE